jgi:hypothetical protein
MERVQHLTAGHVTTFVPGHHLGGNDNLDALGVRFHRRRLKSIALRHTVTHVIETRCLVLVDLGLLINASVKTRGWQRPGLLAVLLETLADGLGVLGRGTCLILQAAVPQVVVEFGQILVPRHRRRPTSLQGLDAILHVGLLIAAGRHAKQRLEHVVACQSLVARMQLPLPAAVNCRRHGLGIVPPNFARHTAKEREALHHAFQDCFGPLTRQGDGERIIRIRPCQHEHRQLLAALGKVNIDVAEVRLQPLAWIVRQRDKRFGVLPLRFANVTAHGIIAALITVLITQPFEEAAARVPLLGRRLFIVGENLLEDGMKGTQLACGRFAEPGKRLGFRVDQYVADLASRIVKRAGDGPNAHTIAPSLSNT